MKITFLTHRVVQWRDTFFLRVLLFGPFQDQGGDHSWCGAFEFDGVLVRVL